MKSRGSDFEKTEIIPKNLEKARVFLELFEKKLIVFEVTIKIFQDFNNGRKVSIYVSWLLYEI